MNRTNVISLLFLATILLVSLSISTQESGSSENPTMTKQDDTAAVKKLAEEYTAAWGVLVHRNLGKAIAGEIGLRSRPVGPRARTEDRPIRLIPWQWIERNTQMAMAARTFGTELSVRHSAATQRAEA